MRAESTHRPVTTTSAPRDRASAMGKALSNEQSDCSEALVRHVHMYILYLHVHMYILYLHVHMYILY